HTRWPRDWSSDVCSSDLNLVEGCPPGAQTPTLAPSIIMQQMGTSLAACVMGYLNFTGETSEAGFTSDPAGDLSDLGIGTAEWMRSEERRVGKECRRGCVA